MGLVSVLHANAYMATSFNCSPLLVGLLGVHGARRGAA
jgi:hypothetical protein